MLTKILLWTGFIIFVTACVGYMLFEIFEDDIGD